MLNILTVPTNPVVFFGDSILSSYNVTDNPQTKTWLHLLNRNPTYGYQGDIFAEAYAGRILQTDTGNTDGTTNAAGLEALAQKLAAYQSDKYWFQIGVNDYGFSDATKNQYTITSFETQYDALVARLHELRPNAKIWIQCIGPDFYEGPNKQSFDPTDTDIPTGPTADDYRAVQKKIAFKYSSFCEYVDFKGTATGTFKGVFDECGVTGMARADIFYQYCPDGIHPNDAGHVRYADAVKSQSTLLQSNPRTMSIITSQTDDTLPKFTTGAPFTAAVYAADGVAPYVYSISAGALPTGINLSSAGAFSGSPTVNNQAFSFTVRATGGDTLFVERTFTGVVTDTASGIVEGTASLAASTAITTDVYDYEWSAFAPTGYSIVAKSGDGLSFAPTAPAAGAGLFAYAKSQGTKTPETRSTGKILFEAKGTGKLTIKQWNTDKWRTANGPNYTPETTNVFTLSPTAFTAFEMPVNIYPLQEICIGIIFSDGANVATNVTFKKNFCLHFDGGFFGLTGAYKRLRADASTLLGNGVQNGNWAGFNDYGLKIPNTKKYLQHDAWARLKFTTDAPWMVVEYVRDAYDNANATIEGIGVFENGTTANYMALSALETAINGYGINIMVNSLKHTFTLTGTKTVEVVSSGQSGGLDASNVHLDPDVYRSGTYLRAVYIPEGYTLTPITTPAAESIVFIGDSIISGFNGNSFPQRDVWIHRVSRYASFNYNGETYGLGNGNRRLVDSCCTFQSSGALTYSQTRTNAFAAQIARFGAKKIWIELSVNDYFIPSGRSTCTSAVFKQCYIGLVSALRTAAPTSKIYMQLTTPINNESAPGTSSLTLPQWRALITAAFNENTATWGNYVELVDFSDIWPATATGSGNLQDGIHPSAQGMITLANAIQSKSTALQPMTLNFNPKTLPTATATMPFSQTFTPVYGTAPYTFSISAGTLPAWLSLTAGGVLAGTPPSAQSASFTVKVVDSTGAQFTQAMTLSVIALQLTLTPASLPTANLTVNYNTQLGVSNGQGPYTYALTGGALPTGMNINSSGLIYGIPTASPGSFSITVTATDANGVTGSKTYAITLAGAPKGLTHTVRYLSATSQLEITAKLLSASTSYLASYWDVHGDAAATSWLSGGNADIPAGQTQAVSVIPKGNYVPGTPTIWLKNINTYFNPSGPTLPTFDAIEQVTVVQA